MTSLSDTAPPAAPLQSPSKSGAQVLVAFGVGLLFALGLGLAGMTQPHNVLAFLDLQAWNPALMFVMVGAIAVHALGMRLVRRLPQPLLGGRFEIPTRRDITWQLVLGSAMFGMGWGLAGFCGGPALVSLVSGQTEVIVFVLAMLAGMWLSPRIARP